MRDRIIITGIGVFMTFGSVGAIERETMDFGQAVVMALIGVTLIWIGARG